MAKNEEPNFHLAVTREELQKAFSTPAVFSNKVYVSRVELGLRLSFCELRENADILESRASVYLPITDALSLRDLLNKQLENIEVAVEAPAETPENQDQSEG